MTDASSFKRHQYSTLRKMQKATKGSGNTHHGRMQSTNTGQHNAAADDWVQTYNQNHGHSYGHGHTRKKNHHSWGGGFHSTSHGDSGGGSGWGGGGDGGCGGGDGGGGGGGGGGDGGGC